MNDIIKLNNNIFNNQQITIDKISKLNRITKCKGLTLNRKNIVGLIKNRNNILKTLKRLEINGDILEEIIYNFYDSSYIDKSNYLSTLKEITRIFYLYQDEFSYYLTDEQIIKYLKECFETYCAGEIIILESLSYENLKNNILNGEYHDRDY